MRSVLSDLVAIMAVPFILVLVVSVVGVCFPLALLRGLLRGDV